MGQERIQPGASQIPQTNEEVQLYTPEVRLTLNPEIVVTPFGPAVFASARAGPSMNNDQLVARLRPNQQGDGQAVVEHTGVTTRYITYLDGVKDPERLVENTAEIGAQLIHGIMDANGWSSVDHVNITSAFLPTEVNELVLLRAGLDPQVTTTRSYRMACAGSVAALIDSIKDPELRSKRVVTLALEPLSYLFNSDNLTLEHVATVAIFGDDYAGIGYRPEDFDLNFADILIVPDGGLIKYHALYKPPPHNPALVPNHYRITDGAGTLVSFSDQGVMIWIQTPEGTVGTSMKNEKTGGFFAVRSARHIKAILAALAPGINITSVIFHPASVPVVEKTDEILVRDLPKLGLNLPRIVCYLDQMGRSNSSSADTLTTWQYMVQHGLVKTSDTILAYAPGIGAAFAGAVLKLR